jgi:hypothetical protein
MKTPMVISTRNPPMVISTRKPLVKMSSIIKIYPRKREKSTAGNL